MPATIFIAHASEDRDAVHQLYARLKQRGYRPWVDKRDLQPGADWQQVIRLTIGKSDYVLACLSAVSVKKRGYVQQEFRLALEAVALQPAGKIFLIPLRLDACEIPDVEFSGLRLVAYHAVDLWEADGYARLCEVIDAGILPAHPTHPRQRHPDWDDAFDACTFEVDSAFRKTALWKDLFDVLVRVPGHRGNVYLVPSGRVPADLRDPRALRNVDGPARTIKREATLTFTSQFRNRDVKGHVFRVRKGTHAAATKLYSSAYDSCLVEHWNIAHPSHA